MTILGIEMTDARHTIFLMQLKAGTQGVCFGFADFCRTPYCTFP